MDNISIHVIEDRWPSWSRYPDGAFVLTRDNWDDYGFKTSFLVNHMRSGDPVQIGMIKIGHLGMPEGKVPLPRFPLPEEYFSIGQDIAYYENLSSLGEAGRIFAQATRDLALTPGRLEALYSESSFTLSLTRSVSEENIRTDFHELLTPQRPRATDNYKVTYSPPKVGDLKRLPSLKFVINNEIHPPTSLHAIIGRNGVGKSTILNSIQKSSMNNNERSPSVGHLSVSGERNIADVVYISFSLFDSDSNIYEASFQETRHKSGSEKVSASTAPNIPALFSEYVTWCGKTTSKLELLRNAIYELDYIPLPDGRSFSEIIFVKDSVASTDQLRREFSALSSGHAIALLATAALCYKAQPRVAVVFDEPETHLHPPLLAALIRAVSLVLTAQDSFAIIATHSPVVLQEIPSQCTYMIDRILDNWSVDRPPFQTYGENLGTITEKVFEHEIRASGFYSLISKSAETAGSLDELMASFPLGLGSQATLLAASMFQHRGKNA